MTMYGAVPEQLRELGLRFVGQNENVSAIQTAVLTALSSTTWTGPARDAFELSWNDQFNPALNGLKAAFETAGKEAITRADGLELVMGSVTASAV